MKIRRASVQDAPALTSLIYASKQSNGYDDAFMAACADELHVAPKDIGARRWWVAENRTLMGCVSLADDGTIHDFFVSPDHKRMGVGRALWAEVRRHAQAQAVPLLRLDADPFAVPFYESLGFRTVAEAPSGSIPGRMLPHMQLTLEMNGGPKPHLTGRP